VEDGERRGMGWRAELVFDETVKRVVFHSGGDYFATVAPDTTVS